MSDGLISGGGASQQSRGLGEDHPGRFGSGWFPPESSEDGAIRWTAGRACVSLDVTGDPVRLCLTVGVPCRGLAKTLTVTADGKRVWRGFITDLDHEIRVDLPPSLTRRSQLGIALLSKRGKPSDWEAGLDTRDLGILVRGLWLESPPSEDHHAIFPTPRLLTWVSVLGSTRRERNIWRPRHPMFWVILVPLFVACLLVAVPLRLLRALRLSPPVDRPRPLPPRPRTTGGRGFKEVQREIYTDPTQTAAGRYTDTEALSRELFTLAHQATAGIWYGGTFKDHRTQRLWRAQRLTPDVRVVDVGCQAGYTLELLHHHFGLTGCGFDLAPLPVRRAQALTGHRHRYFVGDAERMALQSHSVDMVHSSDVLEHIPDVESHLCELGRVLRPGGRVIAYAVSSRNALTWHHWKRTFTRGRLCWSENSGVDPAGHDPQFFLDPAEVRHALEQTGLRVERIIRYHAFFTLIVDENVKILSSAWLQARARWFRRLIAALSKGSERVFQLADEPWLWLGQCNGFFIQVHRPASSSTPKPQS